MRRLYSNLKPQTHKNKSPQKNENSNLFQRMTVSHPETGPFHLLTISNSYNTRKLN